MPASITSQFPTALDVAASFFPMWDSPLGAAVLSDTIGTTDNFLPITDADTFFEPGPSLLVIGGSNEIVYYNGLVDATGVAGVERGVGDSLGLNGVVGTGAAMGTEVRQLLTNVQFRIISDAILKMQAKVGIDGDSEVTSLDFRVATLEAAVLGSSVRCVIINVPVAGGAANGDVVAFDGTNFVPATPATASTNPPLGVVYSVAAGFGNVVLAGKTTGHTGLTAGNDYYLDAAGGDLTTSAGEWFIGTALSTTELALNIRYVGLTGQVKLTGQTMEATVANNEVVAWDGGQWVKADTDHATASNRNVVGVALNVVAAVGDVVLFGLVSGFSGLTAGALYYLSTTAGAITATKPNYASNIRGWTVGVAKSATEVYFHVNREPYATEVSAGPSTASFLLTVNGTVASQLNLLDDYLKTLTITEIGTTDPDTDVTGAELEILTNGSDTTLHYHDARYGYGGTLDKRYYEEMATPYDVANNWNIIRSYPGGVGPTSSIDADGLWNLYTTTTNPPDPATAASRSMGNVLKVWRDHQPDLIFHIKSVSTNSVRYWIALVDAAGSLNSATPATNLAGFRYDSSVDNGNGHWRCVTNDGGVTPTVTDSGVAIAGNTVYDMRIVVGAADVKFYINGTLVATHVTDLPTAGVDMTSSAYVERLGAGERQVKLGWLKCRSK